MYIKNVAYYIITFKHTDPFLSDLFSCLHFQML